MRRFLRTAPLCVFNHIGHAVQKLWDAFPALFACTGRQRAEEALRGFCVWSMPGCALPSCTAAQVKAPWSRCFDKNFLSMGVVRASHRGGQGVSQERSGRLAGEGRHEIFSITRLLSHLKHWDPINNVSLFPSGSLLKERLPALHASCTQRPLKPLRHRRECIARSKTVKWKLSAFKSLLCAFKFVPKSYTVISLLQEHCLHVVLKGVPYPLEPNECPQLVKMDLLTQYPVSAFYFSFQRKREKPTTSERPASGSTVVAPVVLPGGDGGDQVLAQILIISYNWYHIKSVIFEEIRLRRWLLPSSNFSKRSFLRNLSLEMMSKNHQV